jgi:hypothetical protein
VTDEDFGRLRTHLAELADAPAPASPFNAVRTAATGRRRVLARRSWTVGGTGALAVAAVFGIAAVFGSGGLLASDAVAASSGIGADPLAKYFDYGWLPASLPYVSYGSSTVTNSDAIAQGDVTSPIGAPRVDLAPLSGNVLGTPTASERFIPVKLDDGRQAYWVTQSYSHGQFPGDFQLRFPTRNGHWVSITWGADSSGTIKPDYAKIAGVPADPTANPGGPPPASVPVSAQWQKDLLRMATQVTDTPTQVPMPLQMTGLPADFRPAEAFLWHPGGEFGDGAPGTWTATLMFSTASGGDEVTIEVGPHGTLADAKTAPCKTVNGVDACVVAAGHLRAFDKLGGAKELLKRIMPLGLDEKQWTTDVIVS